MKKLIALLVGASVISTGAFATDAAEQAAPSKSDAVMQQLADNSSVTGAATDATASDQAAAPAKKATKHVRHQHHAKKATTPATDATAPASDAVAPATN